MRWNVPEKISVGLFLLFVAWWSVLYFALGGKLNDQNLYWAAVYQLVTWWAGLYGLYTSRSWGGYSSLMGRAIIFLSIGALLQGFGQTTFSIYTTLLGVEIPYPSIADIGYFGSIPFYIAGIASVARIAGVRTALRHYTGRVASLAIPLLMLVVSYWFFLRGYEFDWSSPLRIILDFGYPFGQALYVAIAILALILSRNILGGIMQKPLTLLMLALVAQYAADFNFLYQAANASWMNGGYGDVLYLIAYFLMAMSLVRIQKTLKEHQRGDA